MQWLKYLGVGLAGVLVGVFLVWSFLPALPYGYPPPSPGPYGGWMGPGMMHGGYGGPAGFSGNGERIFFTATNEDGEPIEAVIGRMRMRRAAMGCASCHGVNGRGGRYDTMMGSFEAPGIRYRDLTAETAHRGPYDDEAIKRAIREAKSPGGERLDYPMPRWEIGESDLADLIDYLKTLD